MTEATERWCVIAEWPDYAVSDSGRVQRITNYGRGRAGTLRKLGLVSGYPAVALTDRSGRRRTCLVHRLVASAFVPNPDGLPEVNHIDGTRWNNFYRNLEWVTSSGNRKHAYRTGALSATGENNGQAKLCDADVMAIRYGVEPPEALTIRYGISRATVHDIRARRSWKHLP